MRIGGKVHFVLANRSVLLCFVLNLRCIPWNCASLTMLLVQNDVCEHQVLMQSCADWTVEEKEIVGKILKAMGLTVTERRNWLTKLKIELSRGGGT